MRVTNVGGGGPEGAALALLLSPLVPSPTLSAMLLLLLLMPLAGSLPSSVLLRGCTGCH